MKEFLITSLADCEKTIQYLCSSVFDGQNKIKLIIDAQLTEPCVLNFSSFLCSDIGIDIELKARAHFNMIGVLNLMHDVKLELVARAFYGSSLSIASCINTDNSINFNCFLDIVENDANIENRLAYCIKGKGSLTVNHHQQHQEEHSSSTVSLYGAAYDYAKVNVEGLITLQEDARGSQASFTHKTLACSPFAQVKSVPNLEIKTNEVMCKHATALEQICPEQLFYLMCRGFTQEHARRFIAHNFCLQVFHPSDECSKKISAQIFEK